MTICIAAICEDGNRVIMASDRMVTLDLPSTEFEHGVSKFVKLVNNCYMGTSGDALIHVDIIRRIKQFLKTKTIFNIYEIAELVKEAYNEERIKRINDSIFLPRGISIEDFYNNMNNYPSDFNEKIDDKVEDYDMDIDIIIAGVDDEGGHIFSLRHPGIIDCYDELGYSSIGSGDSHAEWVFIYNNYNPKLSYKEALLTVIKAKKRAEKAQGVGVQTDLIVITNEDTVEYKPEDELINKLTDVYLKSEEKTITDKTLLKSLFLE